jgi:hypothetical protein
MDLECFLPCIRSRRGFGTGHDVFGAGSMEPEWIGWIRSTFCLELGAGMDSEQD